MHFLFTKPFDDCLPGTTHVLPISQTSVHLRYTASATATPVASLTSGMNYHPEVGCTPTRHYFAWFRSVWIHFSSGLLVERHLPFICILRWEATPITWATPSAGSLCKDLEGSFCSVPACSPRASESIPSLALEPPSLGSKVHWRPYETFSLVGSATTRFLS